MGILAPLTRLYGLVRLSLQRLFNQFSLAAPLALGIAIAVMLASAIPMFSDAVQLRVLQERVASNDQVRRRPPFAFLITYYGSINGPIEYEEYLQDDAMVRRRAPAAIGLPISQTVRYLHTPKFRLFPADKAMQYADANTQLEWLSIGALSDFEPRIQVFGALPRPRDDGAIEVLVYSEMANRIGVQAGEDYILYGPPVRGMPPIQQRVHISGIWAEENPDDPYWFYRPDALSDILLVSEAIYARQVAPAIPLDAELSLWYFLADGSGLDTDGVMPLLGRLGRLSAELTAQRNGLAVRVSPVASLQRYVQATNELTLLLVIFSVPLLAVVLYFVIMVSSMVVREQEGEIAVLRSRGASKVGIALLYVIEALIIGLVALGAGLAAGHGLASLMTQLSSFLVFSGEPALPVRLNSQAVRFAIAAAVVAFLAALIPALGAAHRTIVSYRASQARSLRPPFWQRAYLDVLLMAAAVYVYFQLRWSGGILLAGDPQRADDPFTDPVRFLAPAFMLAAAALLLVRFFPLAMRGLSALAARLPVDTALLLTLRSLARAPANYIGPLLLLIFTMGLAVFSSSIALTLDRHLHDATYFRVGADIRLVETGDLSVRMSPFGIVSGGEAGQPPPTSDPEDQAEPVYYTFVPVQEHLRIPGVRSAARVGTFGAQLNVPNAPERAQFIGVDRVDFQLTAYFRDDFAPQPLGALMNQLALNSDALLVGRDFLRRTNLRIGEPLVLTVETAGFGSRPITFTIVGAFDLFPHEGREPQTIFVGNLDYLFEHVGSALPYDVLLAVEPEVTLDQVVDAAGSLGFLVLNGTDARQVIREAQARPERRGVFGLLSAGFIAAALLTVVGFVLSAVITFRERRIQLGMLRTIGLSARQMAAFVALEQILLIGLGALAGSALGVIVSRLYIPFMQVGGAMAASIPPFIVRIAWQDLMLIYASLGLALAMAVGIMLISLRRLKAFEAIKLGAT
ncbi:MAG: FtsX-like permease family protein [Thermoflexales bacterium]|nr:FtsX-like permease family protein [Thermoflexales bacterium]MDW8350521.1 FtsX-like permease family protein [Anaerolineae bacterium]